MEQLVIRLGSTPQDPIYWIVWSEQTSEIIASGELPDASQLSSLQQRAGQRAITALVPTSDILLKWVDLPAKASRKALAAIPYMLEEELSQDINSQFFALGKRVNDSQAVAVVNKAQMESWLSQLQYADLFCSKLVPDCLALPLIENSWSMLELGNQLLLRQDQWGGIQGEHQWVLPATEHYAKQQDEPIVIANFSDLTLPNMANVDMQQQPLELPMKVLAQGALASHFNLLQGQYKAKQQSAGRLGQWRLAASLAVIALLVSLVDKGIEVQQLSQQKAQLSEQIESEFKRAFPDTSRIVNVRSQMRQKLEALEQGGGGVSMLGMLAQLTEAFDTAKVKPQTLKFDSKRSELRLQAVATNFEALEQFKRLAEQQGFTVQQGAINNKDNQVIGSLSIRS
jgi:general secretion pathway protein L